MPGISPSDILDATGNDMSKFVTVAVAVGVTTALIETFTIFPTLV